MEEEEELGSVEGRGGASEDAVMQPGYGSRGRGNGWKRAGVLCGYESTVSNIQIFLHAEWN